MAYLIGATGLLVLLVLVVVVATVVVRLRRFSRAVDALRDQLTRGTDAARGPHTPSVNS